MPTKEYQSKFLELMDHFDLSKVLPMLKEISSVILRGLHGEKDINTQFEEILLRHSTLLDWLKLKQMLGKELPKSGLNDNDAAKNFETVKDHYLNTQAEQKKTIESISRNKEFVKTLASTNELVQTLHSLPVWNCFVEKEKEILLKIFIEMPPFGQFDSDKMGAKNYLFHVLQEIPSYESNILMRIVVSEKFFENAQQIFSLIKQKSDPMPMIKQIGGDILHRILLTNSPQTLSTYLTSSGVQNLFKSVLNLPISVCNILYKLIECELIEFLLNAPPILQKMCKKARILG